MSSNHFINPTRTRGSEEERAASLRKGDLIEMRRVLGRDSWEKRKTALRNEGGRSKEVRSAVMNLVLIL